MRAGWRPTFRRPWAVPAAPITSVASAVQVGICGDVKAVELTTVCNEHSTCMLFLAKRTGNRYRPAVHSSVGYMLQPKWL